MDVQLVEPDPCRLAGVGLGTIASLQLSFRTPTSVVFQDASNCSIIGQRTSRKDGRIDLLLLGDGNRVEYTPGGNRPCPVDALSSDDARYVSILDELV